MNNQEYFKSVEKKISLLTELRKQGISLATRIIGESLLKEDFFFSGSLNRCLNLIDGFIAMLQDRNLTCAGALLRLQMDNCMRTYAAFIAQDKDAVIDCILNGNHIDQQLSNDGKKLSDRYLKRQMSKIDSLFTDAYEQASGYIHLSEKAFYQTVVKCEDNIIDFEVGTKLHERFNTVLLEASEAFIHFVKLYFTMLDAVAERKKRFDIAQDIKQKYCK